MQQRSQNYAYSRKNSTYEHETSTREQILGKEEYRTKPKHRKSLDLSESRSSPPQVNTHTSKSIFLDENYKKQGMKIQQLEQKNTYLEKQLAIERKKNIKLRKIITSKIEKERELEVAYRDIVIQLKKEIKLSPLCFCKSKNNSEKLVDSKIDEDVDLKLQTTALSQQKKLLLEDIQNLKKHLIRLISQILVKQRQKIKLNEIQPNSLQKYHQNGSKSVNQLKVQNMAQDKNKQNEKNIDQLKKQAVVIQRQNNLNQIIKQSSFEFRNSLSEKDRLSLNHEKIDSAQSRQSFKSISQPNRGSRQLNRQSLSKQELPAIQQHLNQKLNNSELFSKFLEQYQKNKEEKQVQRQRDLDCTFKTVPEIEDSFQSIVTEKEEQEWQKDRCSQLIKSDNYERRESQFKSIVHDPHFADVSSVLDKSSKSMNISQHELEEMLKDTTKSRKNSNIEHVSDLKRQILRLEEENSHIIGANNRQLEQERQAFFNFMETIRVFVNKFGIILEQLGNKHKIKFQIPQLKSIAFIVSSKQPLHQILPIMLQFNQKAEHFLKNLVNNIQQIGNSQRKELERKVNNLSLEQSDLKRKLNQIIQNKEVKEKLVQQLKSRVSMLEYELSCRPIDSQTLEEKQKSNFIREVMKQKCSEQQPKLTSTQTQCQLITVENMKKLQKFIQNLPLGVKRFLQKKKIKDVQFIQIKLEGNLENQFNQIFDKAYNYIENSRSPQAEQQLMNRKYSLSLKDIGDFSKKSDKPEIDAQNYYQMQAQLMQLEVKLSQKEEIIERMKKIIAKEKRQSLIKQQENQNILKNVKKEIQQREYLSNLQGTHFKHPKPMIDCQQTPQFRQYSEIKQFNNLSLGKDEVVKQLKQKIEVLQKQVGKYRSDGGKKKKIVYLNH